MYRLKLRSLMSAGEAVGETVFDWCRDALGVTVNEMFGQTEMNYIVGNSYQKWPARAGSMGRPYPGHRVAVIDDDANVLPPAKPARSRFTGATFTAMPIRYFSRILAQSHCRAPSSAAIGAAPATSPARIVTAISGTGAR